MKKPSLSSQTRKNWWTDAALLLSAVAASLSGVYFLFLPVGGFQGGRNPAYGIIVLFSRSTWGLLHLWTGVAMIIAAVIHLAIHWKWVVSMSKRLHKSATRQHLSAMNWKARVNITANILVALGFFVAAISGVYFLFFPGGSHGVADPMLLFNRTIWDLIHTWSGTIMVIAAIVHFAIHWGWVVKVTRRYFMPSHQSLANESSINLAIGD